MNISETAYPKPLNAAHITQTQKESSLNIRKESKIREGRSLQVKKWVQSRLSWKTAGAEKPLLGQEMPNGNVQLTPSVKHSVHNQRRQDKPSPPATLYLQGGPHGT